MHTMGVVLLLGWVLIMQSSHCTCHEDTCRPAMAGTPQKKRSDNAIRQTMRTRVGCLVVVLAWLLGRRHQVESSVPPSAPVTEPKWPRLDDEPQGAAPSLHR